MLKANFLLSKFLSLESHIKYWVESLSWKWKNFNIKVSLYYFQFKSAICILINLQYMTRNCFFQFLLFIKSVILLFIFNCNILHFYSFTVICHFIKCTFLCMKHFLFKYMINVIYSLYIRMKMLRITPNCYLRLKYAFLKMNNWRFY